MTTCEFPDQSSKFYFDNPDIWERLRDGSVDREVAFLDRIFSQHPGVRKILDIGSGSGLHCAKLSALGYQMVGIDLNPNMVEYAQKNHPEGKYIHSDMRGLADKFSKAEFDALICLCTTFCYNTTTPEIVATLANFNRVLRADGVAVIETFNPVSFLQKLKFEGSFFLEDKGSFNKLGLEVDVRHQVNERDQTIEEEKTTSDLETGTVLKVDHSRLRMFFPQEMRMLLDQSGFESLEQYGRYDLDYLALDRTRMITVGKKRAIL